MTTIRDSLHPPLVQAEALRYGEDVDRGRDEDTPGRESQYSDSRRMSIEVAQSWIYPNFPVTSHASIRNWRS